AELATFLNRTFQFTEVETNRKYEDLTPGAWYSEAIANVTGRGIMYAPGSKFEPSKAATREEVAYALAKAYSVKADSATEINLTDIEDISAWAVDSVKALVQNGFIKGNPDGSFKPKASITRAEVVTLLENLTPNFIHEPGTYTEVVKGNVVINTGDVTLKDTTIEGDVYLSAGIGDGKVRLDNVKVTGTVYIQGGNVKLLGDYNIVQVESGKPVEFIKGNMKQMIVAKEGSKIRLYENTVTDYLLVAAKADFTIEGLVKETSTTEKAKMYVEEAGVFIGGNFVPVEVAGTEITINVKELAKQYPMNDRMESLAVYTNVEGAYIEGSFGGAMRTNTAYSFRQADVQLGIFEEMLDKITATSSELKEMADSLGISSDTIYALLSDGGQISLNHMLMQYENVKSLVKSYTGATLPSEYTLKRNLRYENEAPITLTIRLIME
ncbi:MAG: S-layer homology domain-containing protein, partial [Zhenhengia sp.]